jgi:NAD(P)-dependent dehydrogenase (short-subunit alcohol dehydrogenase family)
MVMAKSGISPGEGSVALVTGAGSGMGQLAAQRLARGGAQVAALDVNEEGLRQTTSGQDTIRAWPVDVTNPQAVETAVREVERALGPIDTVYNAAAILRTAPLLEQDRETIHRIMEVNYGGTVNVALATLPSMVERGSGTLVNFASLAGWAPAFYFGAYTASKFAVVAFSETLWQENRGSGVRFVCVCPPPVATPMIEDTGTHPKILEEQPPIEPVEVLDAIDRGLAAGDFFVFPGRGSTALWRARRFLPDLVWRRMRKVEGL